MGKLSGLSKAVKKANKLGGTTAERMARAKKMGFDTDTTYYHGSSRGGYNDTHDIKAFDFDKAGDKWGQDRDAFFFSSNPNEANYYATTDNLGNSVDGAVYPTYQKAKNPLIIDSANDFDLAGEQAVGYWDNRHEDLLRKAKAGGHDAIQLIDRGAYEDGRDIMHIALKPENIRSVNADFNPDLKDSANLMAGVGGAAIVAAVAASPQEAEAGKLSRAAKIGGTTAERMARAKKQGWSDESVYHATATDFDEFDPDRSIGTQYWSTTDKASVEAGEVGAQGKGVIKEMRHRIKNPAGWEDYDKYSTDELIQKGFDGLGLEDADGTITYAAFSPNQYRSVDADFNPDLKDSANLMAGVGGAAVLGGAMAPQDADAAIMEGVATQGLAHDWTNRRADKRGKWTKFKETYGEPVATIGTALASMPVQGLAGLGALAQGYGIDDAVGAMERTGEAMTYAPKSEAGMESLQNVGEAMDILGNSPPAQFYTDHVNQGADWAAENIHPAAGAALKTLPEVVF